MTAFEQLFTTLKQELDKPQLYPIWPSFSIDCDMEEYSYVTLPGLGSLLLLNCASCDGPSDLRHDTCKSCISTRKANALAHNPDQPITKVALCRFYQLSTSTNPTIPPPSQ